MIYFVIAEGTDRVKIGFAVNVKNRLICATFCPFPLRILCEFSSSLMCEDDVHLSLREFRVHREWFRASPLILELAEMISSGSEEKTNTAIEILRKRLEVEKIEEKKRRKVVQDIKKKQYREKLCQRKRLPIDQNTPHKVGIKVYVHYILYDLIKVQADADNVSVTDVVARSLANALNRPDLGTVPRKRMGAPRRDQREPVK